MPNWCHNTLTVTGAGSEIQQFIAKAKPPAADNPHDAPLLTFKSFVPEPVDFDKETAHLHGNHKPAVMPDWYSWRLENWGTKWDASFATEPMVALGTETSDPSAPRQSFTQTDASGASSIKYDFDTAWSPPIPVVNTMAEQHPDLDFVLIWGEPGCDSGGQLHFGDGQLLSEESGDAESYLPEEKMWF